MSRPDIVGAQPNHYLLQDTHMKTDTAITDPLAQDYTIIHHHSPGDFRTDAPTLLRLPNGRLLSTFVVLPLPRSDDASGIFTRIMASDDHGVTWNETARLDDYEMGILVLNGDKVYLIGVEAGRKCLVVAASDDNGDSWSPPVVVKEGRFWNTSTGVVRRGHRLYWCLGAPNAEDDAFNKPGSRIHAVAADLDKNLADPVAWRVSEPLTYPGTPDSLKGPPSAKAKNSCHWLEGNVVDCGDAIRTYWRVRVNVHTTVNVAAVCDLEDDGTTLTQKFRQFLPFPGAQNHFHIIRDEVQGLYWMTSNLRTHDIRNARLSKWNVDGAKNDGRRILALHCSFDAETWLPAGYLIVWPQLIRGANYVTPLIDGEDLLVAARTSVESPKQHDNDLVTFHRIPNFRRLAAPLLPEGWGLSREP